MTSSFKSLRYTTAIAVSLIALSTANQANAACTTASNTLTCSGSVPIPSNIIVDAPVSTVNVLAGAELISTARIDNFWLNTDLTFNNDGLVEVRNTLTSIGAVVGRANTPDLIVNNNATGVIRNKGATNAIGVGADDNNTGFLGTLTLTNAGLIEMTNPVAIAVAGANGIDSVVNTGTIIGRTFLHSGDDTLTNTGTITGDILLGNGNDTLTNNMGGTISAAPTGLNAVIVTGNGNDDIINNGTITATAASAANGNTIAVNGTGVKTLTNTGTIEQLSTNGASDSILVSTGVPSFTLTNTGDITNAGASAGVDGAIQTGNAGVITITNSGNISAHEAIDLGGGSLVLVNETGGQITGVTHAVEVNSANNNSITNNAGAGITGDIILLGGADVIVNTGDITGDIFLGNGNDTLTNDAGAMITSNIHLSAGDDTVTNSGTIDGRVLVTSGSDTITNSATGVIENLVSGDNTQSAIRITGGTLNGGLDNDGRITAVYAPAVSVNGATVTGLIDNSGTIEGTEPATNAGAGLVVINGGDAAGGITNQASGIITGTSIGLNITGNSDVSGEINNAGLISSEIHPDAAYGLSVGSSADVSGGIVNTGTIRGELAGVALASSGDISGGIVNSGTISGEAGGFAGVYLSASSDIFGGLTNQVGGVIEGKVGINVESSSAISGGIANSGTIEGLNGVAINLEGLSTATPITINAGRIIGDVTDNAIANGFSDVTVTGSGFKTEGNFTVSDLTVNAGQDFTISSDNVVTLNDMSVSAGTLIYELGAGSVAQLNVTGAGNDIDITGATIEAFNNGRILSDGDEILIGTGNTAVNGGTGQALTAITENSLLFDISVADGDQAEITSSVDDKELYLLIEKVGSAGALAITENAKKSGFATEAFSGITDTKLLDVIAEVNSANTSEALEAVLQATLPQIDGGSFSAAQNVTGNTLRLVSDRLTIIRDGGGASGISSGDITEDLQMWGQVFGQKINQGQRKGIAGYDAITRGLTIGADTEGLHDNATVGVAVAYANTDVKSNSANNTRSDIGSYNISLYGDYDLNADTYLIGDIGYTYGDNEATRFNVGGVTGLNADSDYGSHQVEARLIAARDYNPAQYEDVRITPKAQVHYIRYQNEDITETGAGGAGLEIDSEALNILEFGVGVDVRKDYVQENGAILSPEVSVGYRYDVIGDAVQTTSTFSGGGPSFRTEGADPDQDTLNLGFGVGYTTPNNMEFTASYDYERKDEFNSNSAFIRIAAPF